MLLSKMASMFRTDRLTDWLPYLAYDEDRDLSMSMRTEHLGSYRKSRL